MTNLKDTVLKKQYFLREPVGSGGMADVYKAWDQSRGVLLAVKVLHSNLASDFSFLEHFREEARALERLQHPNIVRFYSLERDGDLAFIVMDYVDGITLRDEIRMAGGPLSPRRILEIARGICAALNYAHELGYLHCDIKPANILIDKDGAALVADFGITRLAGSSSPLIAHSGTPGYMSPEQIQGEAPSRASDIYSLGTLLFEMLTGQRPFTGKSSTITASTSERIRWEQIHTPPPSLRSFNSAIPRELDAAILRCLEVDPSRRFSSIQELLKALEAPMIALSQAREPFPRAQQREETPIPGIKTEKRQPGNSKNVLLWLALSSMVIILLAFFFLKSGEFGLPVGPPSTTPPFLIRDYDPIMDSKTQPVWYATQITWPTQPGRYVWNVDFPTYAPVLLRMGWCATDQQTLDANWASMDFDLEIDGLLVADSQLKRSFKNRDNLFCYELWGVLEGWSDETHIYIQTHHIYETLFDGSNTYEAGDYIFEFRVNVK